jgi:hypothetical protein
MSTARRVPGLVRQPVLVAPTVVRHRARAQWYPLRLGSRIVLRPGRQTVLLERSVVALARSRLPPAWLLALPAHPLLQAAWHWPVLQARSVAELPPRSWARGELSAAKSKPLRGLRATELQRACS